MTNVVPFPKLENVEEWEDGESCEEGLTRMLRDVGCAEKAPSAILKLERLCQRFDANWRMLGCRPTKATMLLFELQARTDGFKLEEEERIFVEALIKLHENSTQINELFAQLVTDAADIWRNATGTLPPLIAPDEDKLGIWTGIYSLQHPICLLLDTLDVELGLGVVNRSLRFIHEAANLSQARAAIVAYLEKAKEAKD